MTGSRLRSRGAAAFLDRRERHSLLLAAAAADNQPFAAIEADVTIEEDVAHAVETALAQFGNIGTMVHNVAIGPLGTVLDTPPAL